MTEEKKTVENVELSKDAQKVLELVGGLSILELSRLVKAMEEKFDIQPLAAVPMASSGNGEEEAVEEGKSTYDVVLKAAGEKRIAVIKAVRGIDQTLGLKEAKELVEGAPKTVVSGVPVEEAENAKKLLEEAGATVELE